MRARLRINSFAAACEPTSCHMKKREPTSIALRYEGVVHSADAIVPNLVAGNLPADTIRALVSFARVDLRLAVRFLSAWFRRGHWVCGGRGGGRRALLFGVAGGGRGTGFGLCVDVLFPLCDNLLGEL